jgi:hypothetical protein
VSTLGQFQILTMAVSSLVVTILLLVLVKYVLTVDKIALVGAGLSTSAENLFFDDSSASSISLQWTDDYGGACVADPTLDFIESITLPPEDEERDGFYTIGYGEPQGVIGKHKADTILRLKQMLHYMKHTVQNDPRFDTVRHDCLNRHELCAFWRMHRQSCLYAANVRAFVSLV